MKHLLLFATLVFLGLTQRSFDMADLTGYDIGGTGEKGCMPIRLSASDPNDCALLCEKNLSCKAFVYAPKYCPTTNPHGPLCYLKNEIGPRSPSDCHLSGVIRT
jgi:hypothetical protein